MKLSLSLQTSMLQTLTPQQIQYLKLLQLPVLQLEQHIRQEIEENPMLEELEDSGESSPDSDDYEDDIPTIDKSVINERDKFYDDNDNSSEPEGYDDRIASPEDNFDENHHDPFEFYELAWNDTAPSDSQRNDDYDDNDYFQPKDVPSFIDELLTQLRFLELTKEDLILGNI